MTTELDSFARLLQEIPALDEHVGRIDQVEEDAFEISYVDGTQVLLERREARGDFLLDVVIGAANPHARLTIYEMLLNQNLAWRGEGALRLGLAGEDGDVILSASVPSHLLDLSFLHTALQEFVRVAQAWREVVANVSTSIRSGETASTPMPPSYWA